jgi:hypothetical protein
MRTNQVADYFISRAELREFSSRVGHVMNRFNHEAIFGRLESHDDSLAKAVLFPEVGEYRYPFLLRHL